ncbi:hypothetical protein [Demequina soli]|uniref:hypothetical protein n=1 Tax=Demequina soli TaxID=1638987 RepID=UPI0012E07799|nr:hypothetical protein [Demequina soli]
MRAEIARVKTVDPNAVDVQLRLDLVAAVNLAHGDWVATVPFIPALKKITHWFDYVPALISDEAANVLPLTEDALVDATVALEGPLWLARLPETRQHIAGIHGVPALLCAADTADAALRGVIDRLLDTAPQSEAANALRRISDQHAPETGPREDEEIARIVQSRASGDDPEPVDLDAWAAQILGASVRPMAPTRRPPPTPPRPPATTT